MRATNARRRPVVAVAWVVAVLAVISIVLALRATAPWAGAQTSPETTTSVDEPLSSTTTQPESGPTPTSPLEGGTDQVPTTSSGGTTTTGTTAEPEPNGTQDGAKNLKVILLVTLFGAAALGMAMVLILIDRRWAHRSLVSLAARGLSATSTSTPAMPPVAMAANSPSTLAVTGPTITSVQDPVELKATVAGKAHAVVWSVAPADGVGGVPAAGADTATLTFSKAGVYEVLATAGSDVVIHSIVALPAAGETEVPFLGAGWGAVVIAITVAVFTAVLGLSGVVTSETVATVLGALVTFVVVKKADNVA